MIEERRGYEAATGVVAGALAGLLQALPAALAIRRARARATPGARRRALGNVRARRVPDQRQPVGDGQVATRDEIADVAHRPSRTLRAAR